LVLGAARAAWADHGALDARAMHPWLEALLWGALGLAAALIVIIVVMLFSRASPGTKEGERRSL